jgi:hypothetical protein
MAHKHYMPFIVTVDVMAASVPVEQVVGELAVLATRLGCSVQTKIYETDIFAHPDEQPGEVVQRWRRQRKPQVFTWPPVKGDRAMYVETGEICTFNGVHNNGGGYDIVGADGKAQGGLGERAFESGSWLRMHPEFT